jgi:hypothetical protein
MSEYDAVAAKGRAELAEIGTSMLKQKIASMVFLPWLTRYTQGVRDVAIREEREAILALDLPKKIRKLIIARGEPGYSEPQD